jgi:hypothetical protein
VFVLVALVLLASASPAAASVTIGQTGDSTGSNCAIDYDWVQPTVTSGNPYVVPGTGTITSWATFGGEPFPRQLTMKMFRKIGDPDLYQVVGHDGPRNVVPGDTTGNTFGVSIAVKPGDVLGFHTPSGSQECAIPVAGDQYFARLSDLQDGQYGTFSPETDYRLNIQATFVPDNTFGLAATQRNKKKGTATLTFNLPNPGKLTGAGKGARVSVTTSGTVGSVLAPNSGPSQLLVKAKGKQKRKLNETGMVKLRLSVTYTPTGGDPSTQSVKVRLKKKI